MRASPAGAVGAAVAAGAALVASAAVLACLRGDAGAPTTTTSASQSGTLSGTGATGGTGPETDMMGTGRRVKPAVAPRRQEPPDVDPSPAPIADAGSASRAADAAAPSAWE